VIVFVVGFSLVPGARLVQRRDTADEIAKILREQAKILSEQQGHDERLTRKRLVPNSRLKG